MIQNLQEFLDELDDFGEITVPKELKEGTVALARDLFTRIVKKTPIDTGAAKLSWNVSRNGIDPAVVIIFPRKVSREQAEQAALQKLVELEGYNPFEHSIFLSNSLHYIRDLEHGSSRQAPFGMLAVSVAEVEARGDSYFPES